MKNSWKRGSVNHHDKVSVRRVNKKTTCPRCRVYPALPQDENTVIEFIKQGLPSTHGHDIYT
jgi:hypothetical protein